MNNYLPISRFISFVIVMFFIPALCLADISTSQRQSISPAIPSSEAALSVNEPIYIVLGGRGDTKARFQFSFKYRIFDDDSDIVKDYNWLKNMHFAYTQTSLWNLSADSAPFEDSSYRPSLFWDIFTEKNGFWPSLIRTGIEHESNGRDEEASRSIDTLFFWPFWGGTWHERDWLIAPKAYAYTSRGEYNKNIDDYRGYVDLYIRYGRENDWLLSTTLRHAEKNRNMVQVDASFPVRKNIFSRTGGYIYIQLFHGYGESLLSYDEKQDLQFRIGFAIVR